ncbi:transposase [Rickettsia endosymbiont of Ixodes scapularis]|nr:transposase [Rickettsia endosymbiont of Ixodes scapularis]
MFISYKSQISLSKLVQYLKGSSSRIFIARICSFKKTILGQSFVG